jgi:hypothetical protein
MRNCLEKFLTAWRTAAPGCPRRKLESLRYRSFHALRVGQRPMRGCLEKFLVAQASRLYISEWVTAASACPALNITAC